jgi:hypothetical protein
MLSLTQSVGLNSTLATSMKRKNVMQELGLTEADFETPFDEKVCVFVY